MDLCIRPTKLHGGLQVPTSKSQAHRMLITAALASGESRIANVSWSRDLEATAGCLRVLGAELMVQGENVFVRGIGAAPRVRNGALPHFYCGESGSTLRFLLPLALVICGGGVFHGQGRLMERPIAPYYAMFAEQGIRWSACANTLSVQGTLSPGTYCLPGNVSSQFFTGLLLALPLLDGASTIVSTTSLESAGYIRMTRAVMRQFGVRSEQQGSKGFSCRGGQRYRAQSAAVEADWSQAAFWLAANQLGSHIELHGMAADSAQPDRVMVAHCARMRRAGMLVLDVSSCPDLVPPLAVAAALRTGEITTLEHAARLRLKESDRLASVAQTLRAMGAVIEEGEDSLTIVGRDSLRGARLSSCADHRIAMMAAIAATRADGVLQLCGAECVEKSYPGFWRDYVQLGGILE